MQPTEQEIINLIEHGEDISLEFKSDRKCLPDKDLVAAVVALANTEGGIILLGVEDNGEITGVHLNHQDARRISNPGDIGKTC
ncbi:MAG: ATP-binding protein [Bacillota bacterium]